MPPVALELRRPLAQTGQNADPLMVLPRPGEHLLHAGCSVASVKKPVRHSAHPLLSPSTYDPGKQREHTVLPLALARPGLHAVHPGCSVVSVKKPLGHSAQPPVVLET